MNGGATVPLAEEPPLAPEDQARADFYALLARLWYAAPDAALLVAIAGADEMVVEGERGAFAEAWRRFRAAAAATDPESAAREYDDLFVGTGRARVTLYATHYLVKAGAERMLVTLRDDLMELGLTRTGPTNEPEDHLAALCEVMRHLVAHGSSDVALQRQRLFFTRYILPAYNDLLEQVFISLGAQFYSETARLTKAFFDIESASFEMV
jgi:TorA maturation chaperone TorD